MTASTDACEHELMHEANIGAQFQQLPMFMTGSEIRTGWSPPPGDRQTWYHDPIGRTEHPGNRRETDQEVWARKGRENDNQDLGGDYDPQTRSFSPGLTRSMYLTMHAHKYDHQEPIRLQAPLKAGVSGLGEGGKPIIYDGTHRVQHYAQRDNSLIPVKFYEDAHDSERQRNAGDTSWPNIRIEDGDVPGKWPHMEGAYRPGMQETHKAEYDARTKNAKRS